jgi:hypothetical protein
LLVRPPTMARALGAPPPFRTFAPPALPWLSSPNNMPSDHQTCALALMLRPLHLVRERCRIGAVCVCLCLCACVCACVCLCVCLCVCVRARVGRGCGALGAMG